MIGTIFNFRSSILLIVIETCEEYRADELLRTLRTSLGRPLYKWSVTGGLLSTEFRFDFEGDHRESAEILPISGKRTVGDLCTGGFSPFSVRATACALAAGHCRAALGVSMFFGVVTFLLIRMTFTGLSVVLHG